MTASDSAAFAPGVALDSPGASRSLPHGVGPTLVGTGLFVVAILVLRAELASVSWDTMTTAALGIPVAHLLAAGVLTVVNYSVLTAYDFIAFAYIGKTLSRWRVVGTALVAYAVANNFGFAMLSGASVRYRFYSRWGITTEDLSRIIFSSAVTFWLGLLLLGGVSLVVSPLPDVYGLPAASLARPVGWLLIAGSAAYVAATALRRQPIRIARFSLPLPSTRLAFAQLGVSALDWALAGAVLFVLLPSSPASFGVVLGAFLAAQLLGLVSHVPGGLGVFEGLMVLLLAPFFSPGELLPSLIVYRAIYYFVPLCLGVTALAGDELWHRRELAFRLSRVVTRWSARLTPRVLSTLTFVAGLVLLVSGATPAAAGRLELLDRVLPLGVIETSHLVGSIAGVMLLLLSQGLARRLDAAYYLTALVLAGGIASSLLKGVDYEEAAILVGVLALLHHARSRFDRKAALFETRFSPTWIVAVTASLIASVWLGIFAFKHVEYSNDLWWQFTLDDQASRFLRGSVAASMLLVGFGVARLLRHAPHDPPPPIDADLHDAAEAIATQTSTAPYLVYLRDKALIFDENRTAFLMYAVQGRTWVVLGDPVGPVERHTALIRAFLERCDDFGGTPVFYQVHPEHLHHYADFGLTFVKLGEEAMVDLSSFTLEGGHGARYRQALRRLEKDGATFRLIDPPDVPAVMDELRVVSDDWLREKSGGEKGFSLGAFRCDYLARFPVAVVEQGGRIVAFANVWPGPGGEELSVDLMRYHHDAPRGVMDGLLVHLMVVGKAHGYRRFALGMAPMSGFERSPIAPLWSEIGLFLYHHGAPLYNFQGLRAYKDKFDPQWESRYLAYPGGLALPRILADVSALVAGGYRRILLKR